MEERDQYAGQYSKKYYPKDDITSYARYLNLSSAKPRYFSAITKEDLEKMRALMNWNGTVSLTTLVISLMPVIFYKKIPWIRNFRSTLGRVLWSFAFVMIPSAAVSLYSESALRDFVQRRYQLRSSAFTSYKRTGDILKINDEVRIVES